MIKQYLKAGLSAFAFLCFCAVFFAVGPAGAADTVDISPAVGFRKDSFDWNIAGNTSGGNPNVLSELTWKNLDIYMAKLTARAVLSDNFYLRGYADYGLITNGTVQDSDFNGDNRTLEYSRSNSKAGSGDVWDVSGGIGLKTGVDVAGGRLGLMPLVGLSAHAQNLTLYDGSQTIPPTGTFNGLDSTYSALWRGPWAGIDASYGLGKLAVSATAEFHWAFYSAEANWNLRSDLGHPTSFTHEATGYGVVAGLGLGYPLSDRLSINAGVDYQQWQATNGTDRTYLSSGATSDTRLNEVNWSSAGVTAGVTYRFE